jgi:hypothetical protein
VRLEGLGQLKTPLTSSGIVEFFIHEYTLYTVAVSLLRGSKERCLVTTRHGTTMHALLETVQRVFSLRSVTWLYIWHSKAACRFRW